MSSFSELGRRGQVGRLRRLAAKALVGYGIQPIRLRLLTHWHNTTFRLEDDAGQSYMLRIHAANHLNAPSIRSELQWLLALRQQTDLLVPEPVRRLDGDLLCQIGVQGVPETRFCALFRWLPGRFQRRRLSAARAAAVGRLTATLHNFVADWTRPAGFSRPPIVGFQLLAPASMDAAFANHAAIVTPKVRAVFPRVRDKALAHLAELGTGTSQYNLIHADIHQHNFLFQGDQIVLLDFDDCGFGHFVYDMGVTLFYRQRYGHYAAERAAYLAGYRQLRPFSAELEPFVDSCIALRDVLLALYVLARADDHPDARQRAGAYLAAVAQRQASF